MSQRKTTPDGFALPAVLLALVVVGALVTAGFYMAMQEIRIGMASRNAVHAFYAAENALSDARATWNTSAMLTQLDTVLADTTFSGSDTAAGYDWTVNVLRLANRTFLLRAQATQTGGGIYGGGTHSVAQVLRLVTYAVDVPGALTAHGAISFSGSPPLISGVDRVPPGWAGYCPGVLADETGYTSDDTTGMGSSKGKPGSGGCPSNVEGSPCIQEDSALVASLLDPLFDPSNWNTLVSLADKTLSGGNLKPGASTVGGVCNTAALDNWGDPFYPAAPCGSYFPIVHIAGSVQLTGNGNGQGILLVDGDLTTVGTFDYFGVILVRGSIEMKGTPSVYGGVLADSADAMKGTPDLLYSSCAVNRAFLENSSLTTLKPLAERSWVDLTNVMR